MSIEFAVSDVIPAAPRAIYDAWLDGQGHAAMTGGKAAAPGNGVFDDRAA